MQLSIRAALAVFLLLWAPISLAADPLERAVKAGNVAAVRALIEQGAPVDARLDIGRTPLIWAATKGRTSVIQYLIAAGADINAQDNNGSTALMMAIYEGHLDAVTVLVEAGSDVTIKNGDGWSALTLTRSDLRPAATRDGKFAKMHAMIVAAQGRGRRVAARGDAAPQAATAGPAAAPVPSNGQLVMARIINAEQLDRARFSLIARRALEGRGWFVARDGQDVVVGTLTKNGRTYQAEIRWQQPLVIVGYTEGHEGRKDTWIRNLEQDFLRTMHTP